MSRCSNEPRNQSSTLSTQSFLERGFPMAFLALNSQEREALHALLTPLALTNAVRRAQALLWLDAGQSPETVAARLGVSRQTIYNWATRFKERRDHCDMPTRLADDK